MESPIKKFRGELGLDAHSMAAEIMTTFPRYILYEAGALECVPPAIVKMADAFHGEGAGAQLEAEYQTFRANLPPDTLKELEGRLYPAGRCCGMI